MTRHSGRMARTWLWGAYTSWPSSATLNSNLDCSSLTFGGYTTKIMIKINLPNPREMSIGEFFAQMRIALKSAEKSYEEMVKGIELNVDNQPWISFRIQNIRNILGVNEQTHQELYNALDNFICEDESQEIYLEIDKP